jgi:hypothetical protein
MHDLYGRQTILGLQSRRRPLISLAAPPRREGNTPELYDLTIVLEENDCVVFA